MSGATHPPTFHAQEQALGYMTKACFVFSWSDWLKTSVGMQNLTKLYIAELDERDTLNAYNSS